MERMCNEISEGWLGLRAEEGRRTPLFFKTIVPEPLSAVAGVEDSG
jgi:hypothetical protein